MRRLALVACFVLTACGTRSLDVEVSIAADCTVAVPAGGSVLYEIVVDANGADGGAPRVCGGCVQAASAISDAPALLVALRKSAPSCVLSPGATMRIHLDSFSDGSCTNAPTTGRLCGVSGAVVAGGGGSDQSTKATVSCAAGCNTTCTPLSCADQGKECDTVGDGCGTMLTCGICKPPERCGGGGVPNVCAKP